MTEKKYVAILCKSKEWKIIEYLGVRPKYLVWEGLFTKKEAEKYCNDRNALKTPQDIYEDFYKNN